MNNFIFFLGSFYITIGVIFLLIPIIYLELGRPKDLIKAFLNLLIGLLLLIKNKTIEESFFVIFFLITVLVVFYVVELFLSRWHQLTNNEKDKLTTFLEFKNNLSKILDAINLGVRNFAKPINLFTFGRNVKDINSKKWVRNKKNDIIED